MKKSDAPPITQQLLKHVRHWAAPAPKVLWIELTSKCPFRCSFCMREATRHAGEHMDFGLLQSILNQLQSPEIIRLNNSGESIHYPHLIDAIRMSKATGARVELVTTLASASPALIPELIDSGLDQLTVSLHTVDPDQYRKIYGFASFAELDRRLKLLMRHKADAQSSTPVINISFVATKQNLAALPEVARYAIDAGINEIQVHRVIWRDLTNELFEIEVHENRLTPAFRWELENTVEQTRRLFPDLQVVYANNALDTTVEPGGRPEFYSQDMPSGCGIADCIENPWETLNIYSDGAVPACGCRPPQQALGNLRHQSLADIWNGPSFQDFRARYLLGEDESCRRCPWKKIFLPAQFDADLPKPGGWTWQLLRGWYHEENSAALWSKPDAIALLNSLGSRNALKIEMSGLLPKPARSSANRLEISCNGIPAGELINNDHSMLEFAISVPIPGAVTPPYLLRFKTEKYFCPNEDNGSPDIRKLGFALSRLVVV